MEETGSSSLSIAEPQHSLPSAMQPETATVIPSHIGSMLQHYLYLTVL